MVNSTVHWCEYSYVGELITWDQTGRASRQIAYEGLAMKTDACKFSPLTNIFVVFLLPNDTIYIHIPHICTKLSK